MDTLLLIFQTILLIPVNAIIIFYSMQNNLTLKKDSYSLKFGIPFIITTISAIVYFCNREFYTATFKTIYAGIVIVYLLLAFKEKLFKKIFIYFSTVIIIGVIEMIIQGISFMMGYGIASPDEVSYRLIAVLSVFNFTAFLAIVAFTRFNHREEGHKNDNGYEMFALVPFSQLFLTETLFVSTGDEQLTSRHIMLLIIGLFIAVITDILLFRSIRIMQESERNKEKLKILKNKQQFEASYYENIQNSIVQTMKYKHDINNMLTAVNNMIHSNDEKTVAEGIKFFDEIKTKNELLNMPIYTSNTVVNAVVYDKVKRGEEIGIRFNMNLKIPDEINIELTDICSIFSNLLDNALNSAKNSRNKTIELSVWEDIGYLFVKVKNIPDNLDNLSAKKQRNLIDEHGYGLEILENTAKKYDGEFKIHIHGNAVISVCSVKI